MIYETISNAVWHYRRCEAENDATGMKRSSNYIKELCSEYMPSGRGFDAGTRLVLEKSKPDRLQFVTKFHHMNENGYYDGWTDHKVTVTPAFSGVHVAVSGRDRNGIKDYIADIFSDLADLD